MQDFGGKTAVVTGGASGIGFALARRFAAEGMQVVLGDVEEAALHAAVADLEADGAAVLGVVTDVTDPAQVEALAVAAVDRFGGVEVFCNNAGVGGGGAISDAALSTWEWVLGVNLWGVIHGLHAFLPLLRRQKEAHVVNTASIAGLTAPPFMGPYNASKHAVVAISETLHHEMQLEGGHVQVHVLCPGWVATNIADSERNRPEHLAAAGPAPEENGMRNLLRSMVASGMDPGDVAEQVVAAMRDGRFWVLTHDDGMWAEAVDRRIESLRSRGNPVMHLGG